MRPLQGEEVRVAMAAKKRRAAGRECQAFQLMDESKEKRGADALTRSAYVICVTLPCLCV